MIFLLLLPADQEKNRSEGFLKKFGFMVNCTLTLLCFCRPTKIKNCLLLNINVLAYFSHLYIKMF
jgi:hypothetical protein